MDKIALLYTTWPDAETAEAVAAEAVAERLAACVNILGSGRSIYRWQGAVERTVETVAIFKTTAASAGRLTAFIVSLVCDPLRVINGSMSCLIRPSMSRSCCLWCR